jgi:MSP (Major sperm protein) domain
MQGPRLESAGAMTSLQSVTLCTSVTLKHSSDCRDAIVYRVLASRPHLYSIAPASGRLARGESAVVKITVTSNNTDDLSDFLNMYEDTFLVQSAAVK